MAELGEGLSGYLDVQDATLRAPRIEAVSNIGIANTAPQHAFSVGSNLYVSTDSSNVLTVDGNVVCEGVKVGLIEITPSYDFAAVSNVGNVTQSTIQFSNATTGFVTTANIEVGTANLFVDTTTGRVGIGKTDPGAALDVVGDVNATGSLTVIKDIESSNSFITERVLFRETWPNGHNSLIGDLGTWVVTNANFQSSPSITTTPDGYTLVGINGDDSANGEFVSPAFDLSDYAIVDGTHQEDGKRKTTTRVFMKCWFGTRQLDASGEVVQIQFSPDNGTTWYTVATSQDRSGDNRFTMVSADLSPYILETSTNAKIRFYMPWTVGDGDYMRIGRIWIHESDVPTNLGGMWLGAGGNIGIGTTNPVGVNGAGRLEGSSSTGFEYIATRDSNLSDGDFIGGYLFKNADTAGTTPHYAGMAAYGFGANGNMDLRFFAGRDVYEDTPTVPHMTIAKNGNVGIGTTDPRSPLTVYNGEGVHITPTYSVNNSQYSILDFNYGGGTSAGTLSSIRLKCEAVNRDNGAGPFFDYGAQGKLIFQGKTNNLFSGNAGDKTYTNIMTVDGATKNVGIGTTNPSNKLDVSGTVRCTSLIETSDDRIKYNEADISTPLDLINQLNPQKYEKIMEFPQNTESEWIPTDEEWENVKGDYKHGDEFGFIAQDIKKIPELSFLVHGEETRTDTKTSAPEEYSNLTTEEQSTYTTSYVYESNVITQSEYSNLTPEEQGFYSTQYTKQIETQTPLALNYQGLFVVAIGAIQELKAKNDTLEARITALESA